MNVRRPDNHFKIKPKFGLSEQSDHELKEQNPNSEKKRYYKNEKGGQKIKHF